MKEDIDIPKVEDVGVAVVPEENELGEQEWNVYLLNLKNTPLRGIIVSSRGYGQKETTGDKVKTSQLRHFWEELPGKSYVKVEPIMEDVFGLSNEYWVSYYFGDKMFDKKFIFVAESISQDNLIEIPLMKKKGILIL